MQCRSLLPHQAQLTPLRSRWADSAVAPPPRLGNRSYALGWSSSWRILWNPDPQAGLPRPKLSVSLSPLLDPQEPSHLVSILLRRLWYSALFTLTPVVAPACHTFCLSSQALFLFRGFRACVWYLMATHMPDLAGLEPLQWDGSEVLIRIHLLHWSSYLVVLQVFAAWSFVLLVGTHAGLNLAFVPP